MSACEDYGRTQQEKNRFNSIVLNDENNGKKITPYTWIYRWTSENEFTLKTHDDKILDYKPSTVFRHNEAHRYLQKVCDNRPYTIIYHKAGESKLKNCSDVDHFHMLTWHVAHPTSEHSFITLKRILNERSEHPYNINCPKVYNPYGLCAYLEREPEKRIAVAAGNLTTEGQKVVLRKITKKRYQAMQQTEYDNSELPCAGKVRFHHQDNEKM